ncbi:MAG: FlgD immunoglobulin-like domain containing protein, partial [Candidatus Eisenbacteria bacterium]
SLGRLTVAVGVVLLLLGAWVPCAFAPPGNGKLQIHHIDIGQGDGILIVSPLGQLALVDDGTYTNCSAFVSYITGLGITQFDYNFASHYHADHIGCLDDLINAGVLLNIAGYDRGYSYSSQTYTDYVNALGGKRQTIAKNQTVTLDAGAANPVQIKCVDLNGAGVYPVSGSDENSKSVVLKVTYGNFDEVMGGDLTGGSTNDVESTVGPMAGDVEVYKVHHHGSATSTNDNWLNAITPEVGVICVGSNSYGHPTAEALTRLHNHNVKTYWTEIGSGASPVVGWDKVGGTIVIQADPGSGAAYTVSGNGFTDTYYNSGGSQVYTKTYYPAGVTTLTGTIGAGSYQSLGANDGSYLRVNAVKSGSKYYTDWYGTTTISEVPTKLTVTYDGKYSTSRTQTLYLYNFSTSAWTQINQATVGTTDVTKTYETTSPAAFISATGEIRMRVAANGNSKTYSCYGDYMAYTIEYASPTMAELGPGREEVFRAISERGVDFAGAVGPRLMGGIEASPNPFNPAVRVSFELEEAAGAELAVYDISGRRVAVLARGLLERGVHTFVWNGADFEGKPVSSGVYVARLEGEGVSHSLKLVVLR